MLLHVKKWTRQPQRKDTPSYLGGTSTATDRHRIDFLVSLVKLLRVEHCASRERYPFEPPGQERPLGCKSAAAPLSSKTFKDRHAKDHSNQKQLAQSSVAASSVASSLSSAAVAGRRRKRQGSDHDMEILNGGRRVKRNANVNVSAKGTSCVKVEADEVRKVIEKEKAKGGRTSVSVRDSVNIDENDPAFAHQKIPEETAHTASAPFPTIILEQVEDPDPVARDFSRCLTPPRSTCKSCKRKGKAGSPKSCPSAGVPSVTESNGRFGALVCSSHTSKSQSISKNNSSSATRPSLVSRSSKAQQEAGHSCDDCSSSINESELTQEVRSQSSCLIASSSSSDDNTSAGAGNPCSRLCVGQNRLRGIFSDDNSGKEHEKLHENQRDKNCSAEAIFEERTHQLPVEVPEAVRSVITTPLSPSRDEVVAFPTTKADDHVHHEQSGTEDGVVAPETVDLIEFGCTPPRDNNLSRSAQRVTPFSSPTRKTVFPEIKTTEINPTRSTSSNGDAVLIDLLDPGYIFEEEKTGKEAGISSGRREDLVHPTEATISTCRNVLSSAITPPAEKMAAHTEARLQDDINALFGEMPTQQSKASTMVQHTRKTTNTTAPTARDGLGTAATTTARRNKKKRADMCSDSSGYYDSESSCSDSDSQTSNSSDVLVDSTTEERVYWSPSPNKRANGRPAEEKAAANHSKGQNCGDFCAGFSAPSHSTAQHQPDMATGSSSMCKESRRGEEETRRENPFPKLLDLLERQTAGSSLHPRKLELMRAAIPEDLFDKFLSSMQTAERELLEGLSTEFDRRQGRASSVQTEVQLVKKKKFYSPLPDGTMKPWQRWEADDRAPLVEDFPEPMRDVVKRAYSEGVFFVRWTGKVEHYGKQNKKEWPLYEVDKDNRTGCIVLPQPKHVTASQNEMAACGTVLEYLPIESKPVQKEFYCFLCRKYAGFDAPNGDELKEHLNSKLHEKKMSHVATDPAYKSHHYKHVFDYGDSLMFEKRSTGDPGSDVATSVAEVLELCVEAPAPSPSSPATPVDTPRNTHNRTERGDSAAGKKVAPLPHFFTVTSEAQGSASSDSETEEDAAGRNTRHEAKQWNRNIHSSEERCKYSKRSTSNAGAGESCSGAKASAISTTTTQNLVENESAPEIRHAEIMQAEMAKYGVTAEECRQQGHIQWAEKQMRKHGKTPEEIGRICEAIGEEECCRRWTGIGLRYFAFHFERERRETEERAKRLEEERARELETRRIDDAAAQEDSNSGQHKEVKKMTRKDILFARATYLQRKLFDMRTGMPKVPIPEGNQPPTPQAIVACLLAPSDSDSESSQDYAPPEREQSRTVHAFLKSKGDPARFLDKYVERVLRDRESREEQFLKGA
ncbi:unnamed protein product [Amoebophrya sp. A120]|nr:unnamed protein product [Amoebophrya sp. A120]|eukprot:GSA120T00003952001.1